MICQHSSGPPKRAQKESPFDPLFHGFASMHDDFILKLGIAVFEAIRLDESHQTEWLGAPNTPCNFATALESKR